MGLSQPGTGIINCTEALCSDLACLTKYCKCNFVGHAPLRAWQGLVGDYFIKYQYQTPIPCHLKF